MNPHKKTERGQAIVFLVLGFVVFLGFVALAIDGGMLYSNRRNTKNASDASSLSGGGAAALSLANSAAAGENGAIYTEWDCNSYEVAQAIYLAENSAINRAGSNNFTIDTNTSDYNYVEAICGVEPNPSYTDKFIDVTAGISQTTEASFAQVLFPGKLTNVVSATTRVRPMMPFVFGDAIVALRDDCPPGGGSLEFKGGSGEGTDVWVHGGGLFSNSCIKATGGAEAEVLPLGEYDNTCLGDGCYDAAGGGEVSPTPQQGGPELPPYSYTLDPPNCYPPDANFTDHGSFNGNGDLVPGRYTNIQIHNNDDVTMAPGLYCLTGSGDFSINGGTLFGDGVTIYLEKGSYSASGSATIVIHSCMSSECENYAMSKVLFYAAEGDIYMSGNSDSTYTGLVYAPQGLIDLGGTGSGLGEVHVQLVGWEVKIHGDAELNIYYDDALQIWKSAQIELYK